MATHLAETREELEFVASAAGPLAEMIKRIGAWDDSITANGKHPVDHLADVLRETPCNAAHLNYVDDAHLQQLASWPITVTYCPRASAYFGHPHNGGAPHRYRDMLELGINVALGTDSVLCLDTPDRLSVLDEMRMLHRRDGVDPITLLRMATINGAVALGFDPTLVSLAPGSTAGLLAVSIDRQSPRDPLRQALLSDLPPRWVHGPVYGQDSWRVQRGAHS
jgi:cytosine/adenosine deaminase-related metal-dependent hydrolase